MGIQIADLLPYHQQGRLRLENARKSFLIACWVNSTAMLTAVQCFDSEITCYCTELPLLKCCHFQQSLTILTGNNQGFHAAFMKYKDSKLDFHRLSKKARSKVTLMTIYA